MAAAIAPVSSGMPKRPAPAPPFPPQFRDEHRRRESPSQHAHMGGYCNGDRAPSFDAGGGSGLSWPSSMYSW